MKPYVAELHTKKKKKKKKTNQLEYRLHIKGV